MLGISKLMSLGLATGMLLWVLTLSQSVLAQGQDRPKGGGQQPGETSPAPSAPATSPAPPAPGWVVACASQAGTFNCEAAQTLVLNQVSGSPVRVGVAVRILPETKKPRIMLQLPLGVLLPAGVTLQFGKTGGKTIAFRNCEAVGCLAEYFPSDAEINALVNGADLTLVVQTLDKKPFAAKLPAEGFSTAYAKISK